MSSTSPAAITGTVARGGFPRAVVLDLDGTLVDSLPDIADALNAGLAAEKLPPFDLNRVRGLVGGGVKKLVERAFAALGPEYADPDLMRRVLGAAVAYYRAHPCDKTRLYPHAREALDALAHVGVPLGLCTNKPIDITRDILAALDIARYFAAIEGGGALPLKPAPDMLLAACAALGVAPREAVLVGDSGADAGAARAAGSRLVLTTHGYSSTPVAQLAPDALIDGFADLVPVLRTLA